MRCGVYIEPMKLQMRDGRRIILRSPEPEDAAADLACMCQTAGETEFLLNGPEDVSADVARHAAALENVRDDPYALLLLCMHGDEVVGRLHGFVKPGSKVRHRFRLGLCVRQAWWGQRLATAMLRTAARVAREMGCTQMELEVMAHNDRAIHLYEREGYRIVMVHPDAVRFADGRMADEYLMIRKLGE